MEYGAYFYPVTNKCPIKAQRAKEVGVKLIDEPVLAQQADKLFDFHDQPRTYSLGDQATTNWDDSDEPTIAKQTELARDNNLDFFIFDTYMGYKKGQFVQEVVEPLNHFIKLSPCHSMKFGLMLAFSSPRVVLPVPRKKKFEEPRRDYDISIETAHKIVDVCVDKYWNKANYLHIDNRPYLSIFSSDLSRDHEKMKLFRSLIEEMQNYCLKKYRINPYLVGVVRKQESADNFKKAGISALTGYAFLPDFGDDTRPLQDYTDLLEKRQSEWEILNSETTPFVPPTVVGWDASPRGEANLKLSDVIGYYPYTPIVINTGISNFVKMLDRTYSFIMDSVSESHRYGIICSWNEVTEGAAMLPRISSDGSIDWSILHAFKAWKDQL